MANRVHIEHDIEIAAYLECRNRTLLETAWTEGKAFQFVFDDSDGACARIAMEFMVSPEKAYADRLADCRRRIQISKNGWSKSKR